MTGLLASIGGQLNRTCVSYNSRGNLRKGKCTVSLKDVPQPHLIVDFDKPGSPLGPNQTRPDYLFVAEISSQSEWVVPLELRGGKLDAGKVVRQLQAGAGLAEQMVSSKRSIRFRPIVASGAIRKAERLALKRRDRQVRFHNRRAYVHRIRCGKQLAHELR